MPSPRRKKTQDTSRLFSLEVCAFCGTNDRNEVFYGTFYSSKTISLHHNCMFFASGLSQNGEANTGIAGFLLPDIEKELSRGKQLNCSYCRKKGATIGCVEVKCKKNFHLPCGIKNGSLHQFFGSFQSFCKYHMPKQTPLEILEDELRCHICCSALTREELKNCLYPPCCHKNWFHKFCLQQHASNAGLHFFKCPLCNNTTEFIKEMKIHGIHIPEKDASWELEENAYQELLVRPECGAVVCSCAKGRSHCSKRNDGWKLLPCLMCGSDARHIRCENLGRGKRSWKCSECVALELEISKSKIALQEEQGERAMNIKVEKSKESVSNLLSCDEGLSFSVCGSSQEKFVNVKVENSEESASNLPSWYVEQSFTDSNCSLEKAVKLKVENSEENANNFPSRDVGPSFSDSDTCEDKLQYLASIIILYQLQYKDFIWKNGLSQDEYRKSLPRKCKVLKTQENLERTLKELPLFPRDEAKYLTGKNTELLKYFPKNNNNDKSQVLNYPSPEAEKLIDEISSCISENQNNFEQRFFKQPKIEGEVESPATLANCYVYSASLKRINRKVWQQLDKILEFAKYRKLNAVIKIKTEVAEVKASSSRILRSSKAIINDCPRELRRRLNSSSKNRESKDKIRKCIGSSTDFVSRAKSEDHIECESGISHASVRNREIKNCKMENVQRKSCHVNTTGKECRTANVSSNDLKMQIKSNCLDSAFIKEPTARKTCSEKRSVQEPLTKLSNCKKRKTNDLICPPCPLENSAASLNTLDRHLMIKSTDAKLRVDQISSESQVIDLKPDIAIKVEERKPFSSRLRSRSPQTSKNNYQMRKRNKIENSCEHGYCVLRMLGHDCQNITP